MSLSRLVILVAALAVLFAPLAMIGAGGAMAHEAVAAHCADMDTSSDEAPGRDNACMMACAAIPSFSAGVEQVTVAPAPLPHPPLAESVSGLAPEAVTPPPRIS